MKEGDNRRPKIVTTPEWWGDGERLLGTTDGMDTYCCCATPSWFVSVPSRKYEGYFKVSDLVVARSFAVRDCNDSFLHELWRIVGDAEILKSVEDADGRLRVFLIEYQATRHAKVEALLSGAYVHQIKGGGNG